MRYGQMLPGQLNELVLAYRNGTFRIRKYKTEKRTPCARCGKLGVSQTFYYSKQDGYNLGSGCAKKIFEIISREDEDENVPKMSSLRNSLFGKGLL
jgi:hypothetical protein